MGGSVDGDAGRHASQASSHFLLEPVTGVTLYRLELARRQARGRRGALPTGCPELDDHVLMQGGFERGTVVGLSAETMEMALLLGLQTIAHNLVAAQSATRPPLRAAIITPLAPPAILPQLLDVLHAQVQARAPSAHKPADPAADEMASRCLQRISLSRVFDVEGLYDVLRELEVAPHSPAGTGTPPAPTLGQHDDDLDFCDAPVPGQGQASHPPSDGAPEPTPALELPRPFRQDAPTSLPAAKYGPSKTGRTEVMDSEDEGNLLSSSSPLSSPPLSSDPPIASSPAGVPEPRDDGEQATAEEGVIRHEATSRVSSERDTEEQGKEDEARGACPLNAETRLPRGIPDIILTTHMPTLLSHLFTSRDKSAAHTTIQLLSTQLRSLSRSNAGPLIILLNSTSSSTAGTTAAVALDSASPRPGHPPFGPGSVGSRPLDPTLRSIFNPPPPPPTPYLGYRPHASAGDSGAPSRQTKPTFGLTFAQLLDLHLLCTKMPRTRLDVSAGGGLARHAWTIEVLLDEDGLWDAPDVDDEPPGRRANREQRWGAVDVRDGARIVDAFG